MAAETTAAPVRSAADPELPAAPEPSGQSEPPGKAAKPAKSAGKAKPAKGKGAKDAKAKRPAGAASASGRLVLAEHPRAVRSIARSKAWGGLGGFLLGGYLSLPTHAPAEAGLRALAAGLVCYLAAWAGAVFLWRRLVVAELREAQQQLLAAEIAKLRGPGPTV
jgi:hypothetical protein